ncbi:hypothetical protein LZZ85_17530 [Terrimonas sp. NA20]|uniref:Uncharacterized protein n=1 Tax=Terrimonas ginsenosidimutans TaxID=2908004 RepID=A0ABS9KUS9_9BACT|nr:hypothetical protein [Terrimonas ginsenosidimutans]MCG2616102.1 hypothetical protein [Terrimonas ginsenosidimutans]
MCEDTEKAAVARSPFTAARSTVNGERTTAIHFTFPAFGGEYSTKK